MEDMRELITVDTFDRWLLIVAGAWLLVALAAGLIGHLKGKPRAAVRAMALALLAPLIVALYRFYSWTVRVDPDTGYVGLHQVRVFALNLVLFCAVGAAVGFALSRLLRAHDRPAE